MCAAEEMSQSISETRLASASHYYFKQFKPDIAMHAMWQRLLILVSGGEGRQASSVGKCHRYGPRPFTLIPHDLYSLVAEQRVTLVQGFSSMAARQTLACSRVVCGDDN